MERIGNKIIWTLTKRVLPVVAGAIAGYAYYNFIGCNGSCPISGNPYVSTAYGAFAGFLFVDWKTIFKKNKSEEVKDNN